MYTKNLNIGLQFLASGLSKSGAFREKRCGFHLKSEKHNEKHQN